MINCQAAYSDVGDEWPFTRCQGLPKCCKVLQQQVAVLNMIISYYPHASPAGHTRNHLRAFSKTPQQSPSVCPVASATY